MQRLAAGFGMSNSSKFEAFAAEVRIACQGYAPIEIQRAAGLLMRRKERPHIGAIYEALEACLETPVKPTAAPAAPLPPRNDDAMLEVIISWLAGNSILWADFRGEVGDPPPGERSAFVGEAYHRKIVLNAAPEFGDAIADIFHNRGSIPAHRSDWKLDHALSDRLNYALRRSAEATERRLNEFWQAANRVADADAFG